MVYAVVFGFLVRWTKPTTQVRVAVLLAGIAILYPVLRMADYFPTDQLVSISATLSHDRAKSLKFRFDQEEQLLARASERLFFGWGRYGRNRVYDEYGRDASITDGLWILILGQFGLVGFLAQFGLLTLPVFRVGAAIKRVRSAREGIFLAALAGIVAVTVIEQLPNASVTPWSWLLAGVLLGRAESIMSTARYSKMGRQVVTERSQELALMQDQSGSNG